MGFSKRLIKLIKRKSYMLTVPPLPLNDYPEGIGEDLSEMYKQKEKLSRVYASLVAACFASDKVVFQLTQKPLSTILQNDLNISDRGMDTECYNHCMAQFQNMNFIRIVKKGTGKRGKGGATFYAIADKEVLYQLGKSENSVEEEEKEMFTLDSEENVSRSLDLKLDWYEKEAVDSTRRYEDKSNWNVEDDDDET